MPKELSTSEVDFRVMAMGYKGTIFNKNLESIRMGVYEGKFTIAIIQN